MWWAPTTFYHDDGRVNFDGNTNTWFYEYALKDHLGNTRVVFSDRNGDGIVDPFGEISQINHYYPNGLNMEGNWNGTAGTFRKQFNGYEWNENIGLNWNDHHARWYDPTLGRWTTIDPLAAYYHNDSPYSFAFNNPIGFSDANGMEPDGGCGCIPDPDHVHDLPRPSPPDLPSYVQGSSSGPGPGGPGIFSGIATTVTNFFRGSPKGDPENRFWLAPVEIHAGLGDEGAAEMRTKNLLRYIPTVKATKQFEGWFENGIYLTFNFIAPGASYAPALARSELAFMSAKVVIEDEGLNIALGLSDHLEGFSELVKGSTWRIWAKDVEFSSKFLEVINNSSNKIHFNLDGITSASSTKWQLNQALQGFPL